MKTAFLALILLFITGLTACNSEQDKLDAQKEQIQQEADKLRTKIETMQKDIDHIVNEQADSLARSEKMEL